MTIDELIGELEFYKQELGENGGKAEVLIYVGDGNESLADEFAHTKKNSC